jgi:hypothetical protein
MSKGYQLADLLHEIEKIERLRKFVENLFGPDGTNRLARYTPPFDISRPNIHDSKKEFLRELATVTEVKDHLRKTLGLLFQTSRPEERDPLQTAMIGRLSVAIESIALDHGKNEELESASDLALKNVRDTGFYYNSLFVLFEMNGAFEKRLRDLKEQEAQFWTVSNRPPNYYARVIALRFARFFASRTGKRPTFGISSEGAHPSTDYGRALEQVFEILEIRANVRKAAVWALAQLTEDDWKPIQNALAGLEKRLHDFGGLRRPAPGATHEIGKLLHKKGD